MNKEGGLSLRYIAVLIIVVAMIAWYVFFGGSIRVQAADMIKNFLK